MHNTSVGWARWRWRWASGWRWPPAREWVWRGPMIRRRPIRRRRRRILRRALRRQTRRVTSTRRRHSSDTPSTSGEPPSAPAPTPSVPDMNFDSSGGAHTSGDDDDTEVATAARVETETPFAPPKSLKKDNSTLAAQPSATAKVEPSHTPAAAGAFDTARQAKSTTTVTVVGESAQVRLAPAANGGPLAATESQQTPTASMMQVSARIAAQPSTASLGIVNVTTRLLATALALFAQPRPAAPRPTRRRCWRSWPGRAARSSAPSAPGRPTSRRKRRHW